LWLFALGGLFVAVTLFLPKGIVGLWDQWRDARAQRAVSVAAEAGTDIDPTPPRIGRAQTGVQAEEWAKPSGGPEPQPAE
jgi:urea transport system permease protein